MVLKSFSLSGYRGFASKQTLKFGIPSGTAGSGLTVLVGPNNAGKSAVIEALQFLQDPTSAPPLRESQRNALTSGDVRFEYNTDVGLLTLATGPGGGLVWTSLPAGFEQAFLLVLPSRRAFSPRFAVQPIDRVNYARSVTLAGNRQPNPTPFTGRLRGAHDKRKEFNAVMRRILGEAPAWHIEQQDEGQYYLKITSGATPHGSEGLGDGIVSLFMIVDALYDARPGDVVVLDEPELSLHPAVQKRLARYLVEFSANHQVIVATHSPQFVSIPALASGARLVRVALKDKSSTIFELASDTATALATLADDIHNPHTLGLRAKEAFFLEEGVILVEGQEDVMGYERIFSTFPEPIDAGFFGWGTGGAPKMPLIAQMLHELGFERVMGILDSDQAAVVRELGTRFPKYGFQMIPTKDVRDKPETRSRPARFGLLNSDLSVKPEHARVVAALYHDALDYFRAMPAD